jgi:dihydrofolate reductase
VSARYAGRIALVVAMADNGIIGRAGTLPWHLPDDLKHFKSVTLGKPVLMGRRTFESIGKPLPGRRNLVLTRGAARPGDIAQADGLECVASLEAACALVSDAPELCVIGGANVYGQTLPLATRIYLTRVHGEVTGDVYFPPWDAADWQELQRQEHPADARHAHAMSFVTLQRP